LLDLPLYRPEYHKKLEPVNQQKEKNVNKVLYDPNNISTFKPNCWNLLEIKVLQFFYGNIKVKN